MSDRPVLLARGHQPMTPPRVDMPVDMPVEEAPHRAALGGDAPLRVLYAEADESGRSLIRPCLVRGGGRFRVEVVDSGDACWRRLLAESFDALVLDHPLPDGSALEVLRELRARRLVIPVVVVTERGDEAAGVEAMRLGAVDALVRGDDSLAKLPLVLERAVAYRRLREEREGLANLRSALRSIRSSLDLCEVLDQVLQAAGRLCGTERNLVLLKGRGETWTVGASEGFDRRALETARLSRGAGIVGRTLAAREPVPLGAAGFRALEALAPQIPPPRSGFVAPLLVGDRALGMLLVATPTARRLSRAEEGGLRAIADEAAMAIDHAQRLEELKVQGQRFHTLLQLTQRVSGPGTHDEVLRVIAEEARRLLGATAATCRLIEGDELAMAVCAGDCEGIPGSERLRVGEGPCGRVAASGAPLRIVDAAEAGLESGGEWTALAANGIRSFLGVPLLFRERVTGVLSVYGPEPDRFTDDDAALLSGFASQAAIALDNARLNQQLLHAERLSAVGRIVAGVAHELNNPLAVVVGTVDLLRRDSVDPQVAERLQQISGQAQRAVKIVRSLLTLARKKPAQRMDVDVNQLVAETLQLEGYELRRGRVTLVREFAPDLPRIVADPDQLQQVFTNLILNALEAMRETGSAGVLTVATRLEASVGGPPDRIAVTISDAGPGIPSRDLCRIFEPFFTTKGEDKGTGLGLAICRQIVENHRGRITVENQPGAGATFTVELPLPPEAARTAVERPPKEAVVTLRGSVLLVEDEAVVGDLFAEFLALDGHHVDRAANGREALELVRRQAYDLIISDVRMPDLDGPALYGELRASDPDLARRMIFVTGDVMSPDTRRFLDDTGLSYLEKPFAIADLQSAVRAVLSRREAHSTTHRWSA